MDLAAISADEIFYHFYDSVNSIYHFIKSTINGQGTAMSEDFHSTLSGLYSNFGAMARVSDDTTTIWHAVAPSARILYFQHDLIDFSLIGNKYATNYDVVGPNIYAMDIMYDVMYICFSDSSDRIFMRVNTTNQIMIDTMRIDVSSAI